jgi:hypothetical protein
LKFIKKLGKILKKEKTLISLVSNFHRLINLILNFVKYVQIGPNGSITVHKFDFFEKNKKISKKLDEILRLLVKNFF